VRKHKNIYVGDYVRLNEDYVRQWESEKSTRLRNLRETIFLVIDTCYCYASESGGGGMLLTLKPFTGPLVEEGALLGRSEESVEALDPTYVDEVFSRYIEQRHLEQQSVSKL